jgi:hypothetical protein
MEESIVAWDGKADRYHVIFRIQAPTVNLRHGDFFSISLPSIWTVF